MSFGEIVFFAVLISVVVGALIAANTYVNRQARKRELQWRRDRFARLKEDNEEPSQAIQWLNKGLLEEKSNADHNLIKFHNVTLQELGIAYEEYIGVVRLYLGLWWKQLDRLTPTVKQACDGITPLNRGIEELEKWMQIYNITQQDLEVDVATIRSGYMYRCCQVLEEGLYHYPGQPWQDLPEEKVRQALLDYWTNPEPDRIAKWQSWVDAAKLRYAFLLTSRLANGRYRFPKSSEKVDLVLSLLQQAKATPEDILTTAEMLEQLRGFWNVKKKSET